MYEMTLNIQEAIVIEPPPTTLELTETLDPEATDAINEASDDVTSEEADSQDDE